MNKISNSFVADGLCTTSAQAGLLHHASIHRQLRFCYTSVEECACCTCSCTAPSHGYIRCIYERCHRHSTRCLPHVSLCLHGVMLALEMLIGSLCLYTAACCSLVEAPIFPCTVPARCVILSLADFGIVSRYRSSVIVTLSEVCCSSLPGPACPR